MSGGDGEDIIFGNEENDIIDGGTGDDLLMGDEHNDMIKGDLGADVIYGQLGVDTIDGIDGEEDLVIGGPDADACSIDDIDAALECSP